MKVRAENSPLDCFLLVLNLRRYIMYCVITGASRGIGRELAILFAKSKYDLLLTCKTNIDILNDLKSQLEKEYNTKVKIKKGHLDENDFNDIDDLAIVINNASIADYNLLQDVNIDRYNEIIDSNLTDTFLTCKYSIPLFLKNKNGLIVNISSIWGEEGASTEVLYSMTKGGIISFTKALSKELSLSNIDCICFKLGFVDTDMNKYLSEEEKQEFIKDMKDRSLIDKRVVAEKMVSAIMNKKYTTGEIIDIENV